MKLPKFTASILQDFETVVDLGLMVTPKARSNKCSNPVNANGYLNVNAEDSHI